MTETQSSTYQAIRSDHAGPNEQYRAHTAIDHILERLSPLELPAKEAFEHYLRHKSRLSHKRSTLESSFTSIMLFLDFDAVRTGLNKVDPQHPPTWFDQLSASVRLTNLACNVAYGDTLAETA